MLEYVSERKEGWESEWTRMCNDEMQGQVQMETLKLWPPLKRVARNRL